MILDDILASKEREVAPRKAARGFLRALKGEPGGPGIAGPGGMRIIAELKRSSPSRGLIRPDFDPAFLAKRLEEAGATCLSCLTDGPFFGGSLQDLAAARAGTRVPVLRKDFIIHECQVAEAWVAGADALLLIVAAFLGPSAGTRQVADLAHLKETAEYLGMDALVEVHTAEEMAVARDIGAALIGVNNRDLRTFRTALEVTERLAPLAPEGALLVSESGIRSREDLARLASAGARAALIGEQLMSCPDVGAALGEFLAAQR